MHLGPSQHPTQPHDFRSSTQTDFHPWRQQRQPGRAGRGPSTLAKQQPPRKGLTVPPGAAPAEVPVPCSMLPGSAGIRRLSLLQAQWEGRSCGSAWFRGTQEPGYNFASETRNAPRTRSAFAPWARPEKNREQRQKCCQLQLETQLHPNSKALCAAGSGPMHMEKCYFIKVGEGAARGRAMVRWLLKAIV